MPKLGISPKGRGKRKANAWNALVEVPYWPKHWQCFGTNQHLRGRREGGACRWPTLHHKGLLEVSIMSWVGGEARSTFYACVRKRVPCMWFWSHIELLSFAWVKQPVHWFFGDKGLGIQQGTSVWVGWFAQIPSFPLWAGPSPTSLMPLPTWL